MSDDKPKSKDDESNRKADIFNLLDLKIFGINLGDFLKNIDETRERILAQREELRKKLGDNVKIDFDIKVGGLAGEHRVSSGGGHWNELAREKIEWRRRVPTLKITKEDIKRAKEELEKEKQELEKAEKELEKESSY